MKTRILLAILCFALHAEAQSDLFGIVRKNYYSIVTDPLDSNMTYEQFDSATIRLGSTNPTQGYIYNIGSNAYNKTVNLTGAALNPYDNTFIFIGGSTLNTVSLSTGNIINQAALNNPIAASYFDNFRFNNADSSMYGLARRNIYDPVTQTTQGEVYLAKVNTQTGLITQISPASVGYGFALAGSAIDPYKMVFYYSTGSNLVGLDIYNGSKYSDVPISITDGIVFDNFTYSCADTALYGLIRQNYFSYIYNPQSPFDSIEVLDSATIKLGRINPNTGVVTTISPYSIMQGGYSLNSGSAIDPNTMTYFFNRGFNLVGVSLITGLVTSNSSLTYANGQYFELMRNFENCISAASSRSKPAALGIKKDDLFANTSIYPNPVTNQVTINSDVFIKQVSLKSPEGKLVYAQQIGSKRAEIDLTSFEKGIYFLSLTGANGSVSVKKIFKN